MAGVERVIASVGRCCLPAVTGEKLSGRRHKRHLVGSGRVHNGSVAVKLGPPRGVTRGVVLCRCLACAHLCHDERHTRSGYVLLIQRPLGHAQYRATRPPVWGVVRACDRFRAMQRG